MEEFDERDDATDDLALLVNGMGSSAMKTVGVTAAAEDVVLPLLVGLLQHVSHCQFCSWSSAASSLVMGGLWHS